MNNTLIAWIGTTDLRASRGEANGDGPICNAVLDGEFDFIELIATADEDEVAVFTEWLQGYTGSPINIHYADLSSPMDFREVYEAADQCVQAVLANGPTQLTFHLSPGTSAMCAMWLILATTKYDASLIASSLESGVYTPEFPFEIAADYLPRKTAKARSDVVTALYEDRTTAAFDKIIHRCEAMKRVISRAQRVSVFDVPVMLLGESGTGKELFAEAIHNASPRATGPYITVNCGAIPKDLVESALFGHKKGAFTGASEDRPGYFEAANGGTLFLDELGELPLLVQVKLLRVLQEGQVQRVGENQLRNADVRIISATNKDLAVEIQEGRFREDLFHRLALGVLQLPPLRERLGDLTLLVDAKLMSLKDTITREGTRTVPALTAGAKSIINQHTWPGNIRELFNALTRAVIWCESDKISRQEMSDSLLGMGRSDALSVDDVPLGDGFKLDEFLRKAQERLIERAQAISNKQKEVAALLGISDANLRQKLKRIAPDKK